MSQSGESACCGSSKFSDCDRSKAIPTFRIRRSDDSHAQTSRTRRTDPTVSKPSHPFQDAHNSAQKKNQIAHPARGRMGDEMLARVSSLLARVKLDDQLLVDDRVDVFAGRYAIDRALHVVAIEC
jgi:hypothetical protein